jgi:hypothetical protein
VSGNRAANVSADDNGDGRTDRGTVIDSISHDDSVYYGAGAVAIR